MRFLWVGLLLFGPLFAASQDSEFNVNSRYTVEDIRVSGEGWTADPVSTHDSRLSSSLRKDILSLVGQKLSQQSIEDIGRRLRKEFHARSVEHHVMRGRVPETVQVVFDVKLRPARFDIAVPKFLFATDQSPSGAVEATVTAQNHAFTMGLVSDGDELAERYTGFETRYENARLGSDRVKFRFEFDSFHDLWDDRARAAAGDSLVYRARENFEPVVTLQVARPLSVSFGASFEQMQEDTPGGRMVAANSLIAGAKYHQRLEGYASQMDFDGGYDLRSGMKMWASDFAYSRHRWEFRYTWSHGKQVVLDDFTGGVIAGMAPIYERFVLGNSTTLRGWNKYSIDPAGGNRMVHNSVEYRYGVFQAFYDSGAVWDSGEGAVPRNSLGVGLREGVFSLAVAFPLKQGRVDPVFMVSMNY